MIALTVDATAPKSLRAMPGFEGRDLAGRRCLVRRLFENAAPLPLRLSVSQL